MSTPPDSLPGGWHGAAVHVAAAATRTALWNGPVCTVCGRGYLGHHECSIEDLQAKIGALQALVAARLAGEPRNPEEQP